MAGGKISSNGGMSAECTYLNNRHRSMDVLRCYDISYSNQNGKIHCLKSIYLNLQDYSSKFIMFWIKTDIQAKAISFY